MMANEYENVYASLVGFVQEYLEDKTDVRFEDFDNYEELSSMPDGDVVGIRGWSLTLDGTTFEVNTMFTVTTDNDPSGFRRRHLISGLLDRVLPTSQLLYLDATTGLATGFMNVVDGTHVTSTLRSKTRTVQEIAVSLKGDRTLSL